MADEWYKGVLSQSSWHGLEDVKAMPTAEAMIDAGLRSGAWPTRVELRDMFAVSGSVKVPGKAVVARYGDGSLRGLSAVGDRYSPTKPEQWQSLIKTVVKAGGRPTGAFSLRDGTRPLATFEVGDNKGELRTYFNLCDSFDGSLNLLGGETSIRTVCANTLHAAMRQDGRDWLRLTHTASLSDNIIMMGQAIEKTIKSGQKIKEAYAAAKEIRLSKDDAEEIFAKLFPVPKEEGGKKTRALNLRVDAIRSMHRPENTAGETLATIWNGATWLVDRNADGTARKAKGDSDKLDSLLFGTRAKRLAEIEKIMLAYTTDGKVEQVRVTEMVEVDDGPRQLSAGPSYLTDRTPGEDMGID